MGVNGSVTEGEKISMGCYGNNIQSIHAAVLNMFVFE